MRFSRTDEQQQLAESLRAYLENRAPLERTRDQIGAEPGYDPDVWRALGQEFGVIGVALPAAYGGAGSSAVDQAVVLEELGRALLPSPYLSSAVLAATALETSGHDELCQELLPGLAEGKLVATVALLEDHDDWWSTSPATTAEKQRDSWILRGQKRHVTDAAAADLMIVPASAPGGLGLYLVEGGSPGVQCRTDPPLDATRAMAAVRLEGVRARQLATADRAVQVLQRVLQRGAVALACEQVGTAARCLDEAVSYAGTREQFGRAIGSFQSIKHMLADVLVEVEAAHSAAMYASWVCAHEPDRADAAVSVAKSMASDALVQAAKANVQVHGAIGFTWEHDAHLFLRRAMSGRPLLGTPTQHRERLATLLLARATGRSISADD